LKLNIAIDGKTYEVDVEVPEQEMAPRAYPSYLPTSAPSATVIPSPAPVVASPKPNGGESVADEAKVCRSPIAGVVIRVNCQEGQKLQPNDLLMVLEAMKMETNVTAPSAGKVKCINVDPGDPVQGGQVLVEFE
jgi:methylmalonyl-CoA carboxyltransferase small subunit